MGRCMGVSRGKGAHTRVAKSGEDASPRPVSCSLGECLPHCAWAHGVLTWPGRGWVWRAQVQKTMKRIMAVMRWEVGGGGGAAHT